MKCCCTSMDYKLWEGTIRYDKIYRLYFVDNIVSTDTLVDLYKEYVYEEKECITALEKELKEILGRLSVFRTSSGKKKVVASLEGLGFIKYCPFCGTKLPYSFDEDELRAAIWMDYGYEYSPYYYSAYYGDLDGVPVGLPKPKPLPKEFKSDAWWKNRGMDTKEGHIAWRKKFNAWLEKHPPEGMMVQRYVKIGDPFCVDGSNL